MTTAAIFTNNKNQAVRLPNEARFPKTVKRVSVRKVGDEIILSPIESTWTNFFTSDEFEWEGGFERGEQVPSIREELE